MLSYGFYKVGLLSGSIKQISLPEQIFLNFLVVLNRESSFWRVVMKVKAPAMVRMKATRNCGGTAGGEVFFEVTFKNGAKVDVRQVCFCRDQSLASC